MPLESAGAGSFVGFGVAVVVPAVVVRDVVVRCVVVPGVAFVVVGCGAALVGRVADSVC